MNFARIKQGAVVQYLEEVPFAFDGVADFRGLSAQDQAAHGILPVVDVTPEFDPKVYEKVAIDSSNVLPDRVEIAYRLRRTTEDLAAIVYGGAARTERQIRRLVKTDPIEALLVKGGLK